jgi:NTE family protein
VLKALEENGIPIDYITGTSMGALIGALYASGYSPSEIEKIFLSKEFKEWADGELNEKYVYFLREKETNPSLITFKVSTDTLWETSLPTNLISPTAIDYGLMRFFSPSSAIANNNFDSLFIPFRCAASDIISKQSYIFKEGELSIAVRSSMAYPFYLSPVPYEGMLLFDGGLYNNFPSDVMYDEFLPDYIIGSNVSSNFGAPTEDNIVSQIKAIIAEDTEYSVKCDNSIIINPPTNEYSLFNFDENKELIDIGYNSTIELIPEIIKNISSRIDKSELEKRRKEYRSKLPKLIFDDIQISGLTNAQNKYIKNSLRHKKDTIGVEKLHSEYIKISSDDKIKSIYPKATYNKETGYFTLNLTAKKEKDLFISFGGVFSSRPINEGFVSLQYNLLSKVALSLIANSYFGKLHNSISAGFRLDFPFSIPFYWKNTYTIDGWDYFKSKTTFFEDTKPSFLVMNDKYFKSEIGLPIAYKGKIVIEGTAGELVNNYYQTQQFISTDTTDKTRFRNFSNAITFSRNSLDKKQYATKGNYLSLNARFIRGREHTTPGSTSVIENEFDTILDWLQYKATYSQYFNRSSKFRFGIFAEGVYSNQPFFNNYAASILSAPAFQPLSESKTLFQENFRAHSYLGAGIRNVFIPFKNFQIRLEGYVFQPYKAIIQDINNKPLYAKEWAERDFLASLSTVYYTPIGPISLNLNYYEKSEEHWSFLFHFGYLIFNKKSLE